MVSDRSKAVLELDLKNAIKRSYGLGPGELPALPAAYRAGHVAWHPSYDDALAAAEQSGKPVLLFQLLGRLDEALC